MRALSVLTLSFTLGCATPNEATMSLHHLNPEGLHASPAFTQAIAVDGPHRTLFIGGQNAVDGSGAIVGSGDVAAQGAQVARNLLAVLAAGGAEREHVVQWTIYLVQGQDPRAAMGGFMGVWGPAEKPPTISVVQVAGLAHPEFLLEVAAIAAVPAG